MILNKKFSHPGVLILRPLTAAKVSEISETTASAGIAKEDQIHFHIGNPVEDERLNNLYFELIRNGTSLWDRDEHSENPESQNSQQTEFMMRTIGKCTSYMPRGGYNAKSRPHWVDEIESWLTSEQPETLSYDFGDVSGRKECIMINGGREECLRTVIHAISNYAENSTVHFLFYHLRLPDYRPYENISYTHLPANEIESTKILETMAQNKSLEPIFLVLGTTLHENTRRRLRTLAKTGNLFIIEANDAQNHLSLAREAGMRDSVIRIISAAAVCDSCTHLSVNFLLGNAGFLQILETIQFELKGTPSASESEFFVFARKNELEIKWSDQSDSGIDTDPYQETSDIWQNQIKRISNPVNSIAAVMEKQGIVAERTMKTLQSYTVRLSKKIQSVTHIPQNGNDTFGINSSDQIMDLFFKKYADTNWLRELSENFIHVFTGHHSYYAAEKCSVVSGSARTALSLLGFHCGIEQVITSDVGWTYEHVFPRVTRVPLSSELKMDIKGIKYAVESQLQADPQWSRNGAVVINNPHNASGYLMTEKELTPLIRYLLQKKIFIIDDLSYQGVKPEPGISSTPTVKQICNTLILNGYLTPEFRQYVITVHSLSKTDSFAGARLAVIEITHRDLFKRFCLLNAHIVPNHLAILFAYLFYRNTTEKLTHYWGLRNFILAERMQALKKAIDDLPVDRNPYGVILIRPEGSMYPHLKITKLPPGLSLDWLSSQLARHGVGLVPLSAFAHTARGFDEARQSFRLTLGGGETADGLYRKMRRLVIDLNRLVQRENIRYHRPSFIQPAKAVLKDVYFNESADFWKNTVEIVRTQAQNIINKLGKDWPQNIDTSAFISSYLPERLAVLERLFSDRISLAKQFLYFSKEKSDLLLDRLQSEFYKDQLSRRDEQFRIRLYDRTVHPTQMYSLEVERIFNTLTDEYIQSEKRDHRVAWSAAMALANEYFGNNVALDSIQEGVEILCDLRAVNETGYLTEMSDTEVFQPFLSYWGDWDGSTRPSGQGHRLVAAVLLENVSQLSALLLKLSFLDSRLSIDPELLHHIHGLNRRNKQFWSLLNRITRLTNQLEKRLQAFLPISSPSGLMNRFARRIHLTKDPLTVLWEHNDRLERKMRDLRNERRKSLEYYFSLNKKLRKALHAQLPAIKQHLSNPQIALSFGFYRDLLKRFVLTPRIHQNIITSADQFSIDTTVHNITEINEISGNSGNPGMVLALQISMATDASALIVLDRKLRAQKEVVGREQPDVRLPDIRLIPLFENKETIEHLEDYLEKIWAYSLQSRTLDQETGQRFSQIIGELFFAGSDLSQEVSQTYAADLFRRAKRNSIKWLAERGLAEEIRIKMGSGEPMQRQGGYYPGNTTGQVFLDSTNAQKILIQNLPDATLQSTTYARFPLHGILASGDLRTWQSTISEEIRQLQINERTEFILHVRNLQRFDRSEINRITEPFLKTRLRTRERHLQELDMYLDCQNDEIYTNFLGILKENFRQILYGKDEDIVGLHIASYFISRTMPALRDRPTVRPSREVQKSAGTEVISRISRTLPLSRHGSLLRAIGHNRAQTVVLGINQLTTGLFRALHSFSLQNPSIAESESLIANRILPHLAVYEILNTLRLYHDPTLVNAMSIERAFKAGNSSFIALREDLDAMNPLIGLFQKELLRRCGLEVKDFFDGESIKTDLLPAFKPEIAVLLQQDIFNTEYNVLFSNNKIEPDPEWKTEIEKLLTIPEQIKLIRSHIWNLIQEPVYVQVQSFNELARALQILTGTDSVQSIPYTTDLSNVIKMGTHVGNILRGSTDDSLRQFLSDVVELLTELPGRMAKIPVDVIRALRDVEQIARIEGQALAARDQVLVRHFLLRIARISGENG